MIIETSANQFYRVTECASPDMAHLWHGIELKRVKGEWIEKATRAGRKNFTYVRKVATKIVEA